MAWIDQMNTVIDYVENHLKDELDTEAISKIMACPFMVFQRSFVQIAGLTLFEYIRRRRLSCAAYDIQNTEMKIIDIAAQYGYESPDAFSVAFKRLHGIAPLMAKKSETKLKFYTRLHFTFTLKGVYEMDYQLVDKDSFKVLGVRKTTPEGGGTWGIVKSDGSIEKMQKIYGKPIPFGLCFGFGDDGSNDYMVGFEYEGNDIQGFDSYIYPKTTWLIFLAEGSTTDNVLGATWERIYGEFLSQSEYKQADLPTIENYIVWDNEKNYCKVEIWIPIVK